MINVSEIVVDPDFVQSFTYIRREITWVNGRKVITETTHNAVGTLIPEDTENFNNTPQQVEVSGALRVWTHETLKVTSTDDSSDYLSDIVLYKGERYLVNNDRNLKEYGYNRYVCTREGIN